MIKKLFMAVILVAILSWVAGSVLASLNLSTTAEKKKIILILANGKPVAELKILELGDIKLDFKNESCMKGKDDSNVYICSGGGKISFSDKTKKETFTLSADRLQIQDISETVKSSLNTK